MTIIVTGAAGFIGYHVADALLQRGDEVIGIDNLNAYYSVQLKRARLARLSNRHGFQFHNVDIADYVSLSSVLSAVDATTVVHLAAQAGIRHSIAAPFDYVHSNLAGHASILELCRHRPIDHLVYASSSSVYGRLDLEEFAETDSTDRPHSLYAATKKADELLSHSYAHMYGLKQTGLRFFTVYGPWGRPDMAYWRFADAILSGDPLHLFNGGNMWRDFTYVDDAIAGVLAALAWRDPGTGGAPHRIFNLGNNRPVKVLEMVRTLERRLERRARIVLEDMPPGEVIRTCADVSAASRELGYRPNVRLEEGLSRFVDWYLEFRPILAKSA